MGVYGMWQIQLRQSIFLFSSKHSTWDDQANLGLHSSLQSSFQMTVEKYSAIAIDTLSDGLKNLEPVSQPMKTWQT